MSILSVSRITRLVPMAVVLASGLFVSLPLSAIAQLHLTGFSYGMTSKAASLQQRVRQATGSSSDVRVSSQNLSPSAQSLLQPALALPSDAEILYQQTISNSRAESRNSSLTLIHNFTYSVFRNSQPQPSN